MNNNFPGSLLIITLLSLPFVVGSSCIVIFGSGDGSSDHDIRDEIIDDDDDDDDDSDREVVVIKTGNFTAPATQGLDYESGALSGVTGEDGEFEYEAGQPVQFSIGDVSLGTAVPGSSVITPDDLVREESDAPAAAVNITRLLQSLDDDPSDDSVSISAAARAAAVHSNTSVSAALASLDFSNEVRFTNAASQLVATLTANYPFTATLVDATDAKRASTGPDSGNEQP